MIYFTADTHFQHKNIIKYCNRPFFNIEEHDETLIDNWNKVVKDDDIIYHLGDFCFSDHNKILRRLKGKIIFIKGSHDKWLTHPYIINLVIDKKPITLCHYAMRVWHRSHYNSWSLFGHSHGNLKGQGKSFDVGVDCWGYKPISWDEVKFIMTSKPDNFNLVKR